MIITISGKAGSGKSTVAKIIASKLNLVHYSIGDLMREMTKERGVSLIELNNLAEKDGTIDKELDDKLIKLGKEKKEFVIDGRLTAFFIPHADLKVFLDADERVRAQRIFKDRRDQEKNTSMEEAVTNLKKREVSEKKRYMKYYGVDYFDCSLYDYTIDTTSLSPEEVALKIIKIVKKNWITN